MELNDFKQKEINKPATSQVTGRNADDSLQNLVEAVKTTDTQDQKKILRLIPVFFVLLVVYFGSFSINNGCMKAGFGLLIFAFLLILGFISYKYLKSKKINYSEPITLFLRHAEQRCRFMSLTDTIISIPLLALLIYSGGLLVWCSFDKYFPGSPVPLIIYGLFMTAVVIIGFWSTYRDWKKTKKPLLDKIREVRKELFPES